jgi:tRNA pseudouridine55 synthase
MAWIYLNKPSGIRSITALNLIKKKLNVKCGVWGILDEFAQGLLPIATESTTKLIDQYKDEVIKKYTFTVQWGAMTDTGDYKGKIIGTNPNTPTIEQIKSIIPNFIGEITQIPPIYSNIKINGVRAHELARQGENVAMPSRSVKIIDLILIHHNYNETTFAVEVGHGTYIRSLAQDIAIQLNTLGHLIYLRREWVRVKDEIFMPTIDLDYFITQDFPKPQ